MSETGKATQAQETLVESPELFRILAETSLDLIQLIETDGRVVYASPSTVRFLGKHPARQFESVHPDDLDGAQRWWTRLLAGGSDRLDLRIQGEDGAWNWWETWGTSLTHDGKPHLLTFCRDINERIRMIEALRESQRKLEDAQEIAQLGYWENDLDADRITWSDAAYRILGLERGSIVPGSRTLRDLIHPDDRQLQADATARVQRGENRYDVEYRIIRPDGDVRTIHSLGYVVHDESGRPQRAFGVVQDITELKTAEQALRERHGLFNAIIEGTSDAVFVKNTDGRYLMMNAAGARFFGRTADEVIDRTDRDIFGPDVSEAVLKRDREVIESGSSGTFEEEHIVAGVTRTYVVTRSAYRDWHGSVIGLVGISSDVTDLKRLEKQFREAQKMEAVGRLAGGVAHDFNNLLTVINSYSEMMLKDLSPDHRDREALAEIRHAGDRAASLTRQLLAFSRNQILQPRVVNLNTTLPDMLKMLRRLIGEDVAVAFVAGAELGRTRVDPMHLDQAIINLAVNARDAMPEGGRLTIETRNAEVDAAQTATGLDVHPGQYVTVSVSDSGQGMDEATSARAFEPFFTTKGVGKGTGLGLAMVYGFVKQSGGHIEMTSTPGQGTTFTIYLPRSFESDVVMRRERERRNSVGTETVLLVEDEDAVRKLSRRILESRGFVVVEARNGQDALRIAKHHTGAIHLLLTDLVMPHISGRELAEELTLLRPDLRVLFMSGYTDEAMLPQAVAESHGNFLQKPFGPVELVGKIRDVLDRE